MQYLLPDGFPLTGLSAVQLSKIEFFYERFVIRAYEQYGMGHFALACYGALPAVLSPELVYKLWLNFKNYNLEASPAIIHPVAPVDLMLSPLVEEIGYELYEMPEEIRKALMVYLENNTASPEANKYKLFSLENIAGFLNDYITIDFKAENKHDHAIREAQEWTAMSYLQPGNAFAKVALAFQTAETNAQKARYKDAIEKMSGRFSLNIVKDAAMIPEDFNALTALTSVARDLVSNRNPKNLQELLLAASKKSDLLTAAPIINQNIINIEVPEQVGKKFLPSQTLSSTKTGKLKGLIVGVEQQQPEKKKDNTDAKTAEFFYSVLNKILDEDKKVLTILSGRHATKRAILTAWNELLQDINENDNVLFYLAANGERSHEHCVVLCTEDTTDPDGSKLSDHEIGDLIKGVQCASVTMILQIDHAATPYWLDISDPRNVIFASCKYDQVPSFFNTKTPDGIYCAYTYALVQALREKAMQMTNRELFIHALQRYEALISFDKSSVSREDKSPQLICQPLALDRFFIQGKNSSVTLQQILVDTGFMDNEITGAWDTLTASSLSRFVKQMDISPKLNKQEYIKRLKAYDENAAQNRFPVFLLIFSDPDKKLAAIENEKQAILKKFGKANSKVKAEVLIDPNREKLENAFRKSNYRNKIELIYYSGNEDKGNFDLKDGTFNLSEFASLLIYQKNIKLFVSNTCRSEQFADYSTQLGISMAIGIKGQIIDEMGAEFGERLFQWIFDGRDLESFMDEIKIKSKEDAAWSAFKLFRSRWNSGELKTIFNLPNYEGLVGDTGEVFSLSIVFDNYEFLGKHTAVPESYLLQSWLKKNNGSQNNILLGSFSGSLPNKDDVDRKFDEIISLARNSKSTKKTLVVYLWGKGLMLENGTLLICLPGMSDLRKNSSLNVRQYFRERVEMGLFNEVLFFYDLGKATTLPGAQEIGQQFEYPKGERRTNFFLLGNLMEEERSYGLFTKKMIEALNGKAADKSGNITASSILAYLRNILPTVKGEYDVTDHNINLSTIFKKLSPDCSIKFSDEHNGKKVEILNDRHEEVYSMIINSHSLKLQLLPGDYRLLIPEMEIDTTFAVKVSEKTVTIDLSREFRNQWICVIGSGSDLTEKETVTAKAIGTFLAKQGFRLITGGCPGVDEITSQAFYDAVILYGKNKANDYLMQVVEKGRVPEFKKGTIEFVSAEEWKNYVFEKCLAFISIGGKGYTYEMFERSSALNISFIPLPFTGGDSSMIYNRLINENASELLLQLKGMETTDEACLLILNKILDQINARRTQPDHSKRADDPHDKELKMSLLSEIQINREDATSFLQLLHGDLTALTKEHAVDILVVSAFPGDYLPIPGTLMAALHGKGVLVEEMAKDKEVDLINELGCWLSKPLSDQQQAELNFKRILCFEPYPHSSSPQTLVGNIFRCINTFAFDDHNSTIALPVIASGNQQVPIQEMLPVILDMAILWLKNGLPFNCIKLALHTQQQVDIALPIFTEAKNRHTKSQVGVLSSPISTYDFFISYAHVQFDIVKVFVDAMKEKNNALNIFYDKNAIPVGGSWLKEISDAIGKSKKVLVFMSPDYSASMFCWDEFQCAKLKEYNEKASVIQTIYLYTDPNLPSIMSVHSYFDCREGDLEKLKAAAYRIAEKP